MSTELATRRPIRKLSRADLATFPVWEWALGEEGIGDQDESFVRPTPFEVIPEGAFCQYIVAATATLRDGTQMSACAEVTTKGKKRHIAPMFVFLHDRHLDFTGHDTTRMLSRFTSELNNYPVRWQLAVPLEGEARPRAGRVRRGLALRLLQFWMRTRLAG